MLEDKAGIQEFAVKFCAEKKEMNRFQAGDIKCGVSGAGGFYIEAKGKNIHIDKEGEILYNQKPIQEDDLDAVIALVNDVALAKEEGFLKPLPSRQVAHNIAKVVVAASSRGDDRIVPNSSVGAKDRGSRSR